MLHQSKEECKYFFKTNFSLPHEDDEFAEHHIMEIHNLLKIVNKESLFVTDW